MKFRNALKERPKKLRGEDKQFNIWDKGARQHDLEVTIICISRDFFHHGLHSTSL